MIVNKTTNDYVDALLEKYPDVSRSDIKRIIDYGWKLVYLLNSYGGDITINKNNHWIHFGNLYVDSLLHCINYIRKLALKIRILYKRRKPEWDGYYYFALTDSKYLDYLSQINKKGRKKKWFTFNKIMLYKIKDECIVKNHFSKYIFRVNYLIDVGYKVYKEQFKTDKAELIICKDSLQFKDILVSNNKYEYV